jgi:RimJ/RimL family protein N-acetyltransferase
MISRGNKIYLQEGLREEDYALVLQGLTDVAVIGLVSFAKDTTKFKTIAEAKKFVYRTPGETIFGIYTSEDKFIGYTTLEPEGDDVCEYAIYILDKNYWSQGIGEEVTKLMLDYAFAVLKFKKVVLSASECHQKAIMLYEKMGFQKTKLIPNDREIFLDGQWTLGGTVEMEINK